jgi:hypothetical protein
MNMGDIDKGRTLALNGSLQQAQRWLIALMGLPLVGVVVALVFGYTHAASAARTPMLFAAATAPLVILLATAMILRSLKRAGVSVDQGELVVRPGIGSKRIELSALRSHGLSIVDLRERTELKPVLKLWGTSLPGFAGGRFRLRNGDSAICLLLDRSRVSYLRSDDGMAVLLSLKEPEQLRALLQR